MWFRWIWGSIGFRGAKRIPTEAPLLGYSDDESLCPVAATVVIAKIEKQLSCGCPRARSQVASLSSPRKGGGIVHMIVLSTGLHRGYFRVPCSDKGRCLTRLDDEPYHRSSTK